MQKTKTILVEFILLFAASACTISTPLPAPIIASTQEQILIPELTSTPIVIPTQTQPLYSPSITEAEVPRVTPKDAKAAFDSGAAIIVDVRGKQAYDASHVAGAINIQLDVIETTPTKLGLDKNQWIITYCT